MGIAIAATLLGAMGLFAWWTQHTQQHYVARARTDQVRAIGALLTQASELALAQDDLASARRLIADAAVRDDLALCRIVLPHGEVIADSDVSHITMHKLAGSWTSSSPQGDAEKVEFGDGAVRGSFPLMVANRGGARLEIAANIEQPFGALWEAQSGVGAIGAMSLAALLLVYGRARRRLRGVAAVHRALLSISQGETSDDVLRLADTLGPEAVAWNQILREREELRAKLNGERTREVLQSRRSGRGDLDAAFDAMAQGILLVDEKLRIRHANGAAAVFLRVKRDGLIGSEVGAAISQSDVLESIAAITSGTVRKRTQIEVERDGSSGEGGVLRFSIRPVRREDSAAAMVTIDDVTQQKVAEEARNAFVAHATHELRTPLTNIRLYLETVIDEGEKDPALRGKCLNVINQEARRLERIVGEMLSVSEIEAGSLRIRRDDVNLETILTDLRLEYEPQAREKKVDLRFELPPKLPTLQGDRDKLLLALHNLVGNALKYTEAQGQVTVALKSDEVGKQIVFSVQDTGIGIGEEDVERIFERFYRAKDQRVSKITGTGLGLTLAREIARLHGGDISVVSELNKGSTFTIVLPTCAESVAA
jgi:PAS domain S-box-containing protein